MDDLYKILSGSGHNRAQRTSYSGRLVSPSYIDAVGRCPMKAFVDRFSTSSYDSYIRNSLDAEGTAVHKAIEDSMNFLTSKKGGNPSKKQIENLLSEARVKAEQALKRHLPAGGIGSMRDFVDKTINEYGREYLANPDLHMATEFNVSTRGLPGRQVGGNVDFIMYNAKEKALQIHDLKWARKSAAETSHDWLSSSSTKDAFDLFSTGNAQPRVYASSILEMFGGGETPLINTVQFVYDVGKLEDGKQAKYKRITSAIIHNNEDTRTRLAKGITADVAHIINMEQQVASSMLSRNKDSALRAMGTLARGKCNPGTCAVCPMRYQCKFKTFVEDAIESSKGEKGQWSIDSELRKFDHLQDKEFTKQMDQQYNEFIKDSYRKEYLNAKTRFQSEGIPDKEAAKMARKEATGLKTSMQSFQKTKRGLFHDELFAGINAPKSPLMFSILDNDFKASWMSNQVRRGIAKYSYTQIESLSKSFDVPENLAKKVVMDAVYKDRENAFRLNRLMIDNTNKVLEEMGISLRKLKSSTSSIEEDVQFALRKYRKTINRDVATIVNDSINKEFLKYVISIDQEALKAKIGPFKGMNIDDIYKKAVSSKLMSQDTTQFIKNVARDETFGDIFERGGGKLNKFPLGSVMIAGMLSYIAGMNSVNDMISNKFDKMQFYMNHNEREIDAGQHASVYTSARRLMYSDFGSPMRFVLRRSKMVLDHIGNMTGEVKDYLSVALSIEGKNRTWKNIASESIVRSGKDISKSMRNLDFIKSNPGMLIAGAAAGFITFGILPHFKTDRDVKAAANDRKRRLKQTKKMSWNRTSAAEAPEGELREWYRRWLPLGSSIISGIAAEFIAPSIKRVNLVKFSEYGKKIYTDILPKIKESILSFWEGSKARPEAVYTKSMLNRVRSEFADGISEIESSKALSQPKAMIKKAAIEGRQAIQEGIDSAKRHGVAVKKYTDSKLGLQEKEEFVSSLEIRPAVKRAMGKAKSGAKEAVGNIDELIHVVNSKTLLSMSFIPGKGLKDRTQHITTTKSRTGTQYEPISYERGVKKYPDIAPVARYNESGFNPVINIPHHKTRLLSTHMFEKHGTQSYPMVPISSRRTEAPRVDTAYPKQNIQVCQHPVQVRSQHKDTRELNSYLMNPDKNFYHSSGSKTLNKIYNLTRSR